MKIGDRVVMQSGSPVMTVIGIEKDPATHGSDETRRLIWVQFWDAETHKMESHQFPAGALRDYEVWAEEKRGQR